MQSEKLVTKTYFKFYITQSQLKETQSDFIFIVIVFFQHKKKFFYFYFKENIMTDSTVEILSTTPVGLITSIITVNSNIINFIMIKIYFKLLEVG